MTVGRRQPDASEGKLLEATVGPGDYRVLTRRPLTIAVAPGASAPALVAAALGFMVEFHRGIATAALAAAIAGAGLALAIAAHEAGHLLFGSHVRGLVPRILLLRSGGGASIVEGRFEDARGAAVFAAGGPAASLMLTVSYVVAATLAPWPALRVGLLVPALVNALLLLINLLPVAPTDGYALFRSALWAETGNRAEAERRAIAWSRVVLAIGLVVSLELAASHQLAGVLALFAVTTLTVQHHAVARRVEHRPALRGD
jgi:Zn-dependent protease